MSVRRDNEFYMALVRSDTVSVVFADPDDTVYTGKAVATTTFDGGFCVGFEPSRDLVTDDDQVEYGFQESEDGSTGWADIPAAAVLPTWKQPGNLLEEIESASVEYIQSAAAITNKAFVRVKLIRKVLTGTDVTIRLVYTQKANLAPFTGWSATPQPNDGRP